MPSPACANPRGSGLLALQVEPGQLRTAPGTGLVQLGGSFARLRQPATFGHGLSARLFQAHCAAPRLHGEEADTEKKCTQRAEPSPGHQRCGRRGSQPARRITYVATMAHYSRLYAIVVDAPAERHDQELAFWQAATGQPLARIDEHPEYHAAASHGQEFMLLIQRLDGGPGRVHLDIHTDDLEAEVARLELLGASRIQQVNSWWVMRDPADLLFCVVPDPPGTLSDANARRWG